MSTSHRIFTAAALLCVPACGIPMEEYDARTAELRKAEEKVKVCDDAIRFEQGKANDATAGLEEMRSMVKEMQHERKELGINSAADFPAVRSAVADSARTRQSAAERKAERELLTRSLKPELDGGVLWIDERGGVVRLVLPEESLFGSNSANVGPPGRKVLDSIVRELKAMPRREILVSAYLDRKAKSDPEKDMALTLDRAWHVADYFGKQGVDKSLVAAAGYGELEPIADNDNQSVRQRNRRVEILLLGPVAEAAPAPAVAAPARTPAARTSPPPTASPKPAPTAVPAGISDDPGL